MDNNYRNMNDTNNTNNTNSTNNNTNNVNFTMSGNPYNPDESQKLEKNVLIQILSLIEYCLVKKLVALLLGNGLLMEMDYLKKSYITRSGSSSKLIMLE